MRYFITGGAGFIGREVAKQLLNANNSVCIYDDLSFGRKSNIEEFIKNKRFKFVKGKIENHLQLFESMRQFKPNIVIHLAALHFIPYCNAHPLETIKINVDGTYSVFEAAKKLRVSKLLFASSGALYDSVKHPLNEVKDLPSPVDIYGLSKLLGEQICEYFSKTSDLKIIAMRFFNTFGPFETNEHLLPEIMKQLHKSNVLQLGNISTKRDYIYVTDIAKGVILLSRTSNLRKYELVNIGTGREFSALEIVNFISKILGREISIKVDKKRLRQSDKMHQIAEVKNLFRIIGWKPSVQIEQGLYQLIKFEKLV